MERLTRFFLIVVIAAALYAWLQIYFMSAGA
jgi:hypothetical protein